MRLMAPRSRHPRLLALLSLLLTLACDREPDSVAEDSSRRTLTGKGGSVTGMVGRYGNHEWRGLPYAEPPVGARRFRAPEPLVAGRGAREALQFSPPCVQFAHPFGVNDAPTGEVVGSEDCLYLNVYAPRMTQAEANRAKLPVMVWLHGGGNVVGHAAGYHGGNLAQRERVLVVAPNYRLGPLGWFHHPALADPARPADGSGNYGLLDAIEALRWVRANAASFGGDASNVTVFGESAGARDVMALLISPPARGLFERAIAQSGAARHFDAKSASALASEGGHVNSSGEVLVRLLQRESQDGRALDAPSARKRLAAMEPAAIAAYLRAKPPSELLAAYQHDDQESMLSLPNLIADGTVLPTTRLLELYAQPDGHARVPVMMGTNRDEMKTFLFSSREHVRRITPLFMRVRDPARYEALSEALSSAWRVSGADAPAAALARNQPEVFVYRFDWDEEPTILGADLSKMLGAGHGLEIPFVFGHFDLGRRANLIFTDENQPGREQLSERMMGYWAEFARRGKPGRGGAVHAPEWAPFAAQQDAPSFMVFDTDASGGVRLQRGATSLDGVVQRVRESKKLVSPRQRCRVLRELARTSGLLERSDYPRIGGEECESYPFESYPWGEG